MGATFFTKDNTLAEFIGEIGVCSNCGGTNINEAKYCMHCGEMFTDKRLATCDDCLNKKACTIVSNFNSANCYYFRPKNNKKKQVRCSRLSCVCENRR